MSLGVRRIEPESQIPKLAADGQGIGLRKSLKLVLFSKTRKMTKIICRVVYNPKSQKDE
jgi:hypothetical protein